MVFYYISLFFLGAIFGSFLNVLIYRLPRGEEFVKSRSKCPRCRSVLKWYDLVPLLSFLILKGKCRRCGKKISWSYFGVELTSGLFFIFSYIFLIGGGIIFWLVNLFLLEILLTLLVTDIKELILPDTLVYSGLVVVLLAGFAEKLGYLDFHFNFLSIDHLAAAILFFLFFFSIWFFSKGKWVGLGDGKLMALVGLFFGALNSALVFYLAVIMGTAAAVVLMAFKKANLKTKLPLGAFISLAAVIFIFWGYDIINAVGRLKIIF